MKTAKNPRTQKQKLITLQYQNKKDICKSLKNNSKYFAKDVPNNLIIYLTELRKYNYHNKRNNKKEVEKLELKLNNIVEFY